MILFHVIASGEAWIETYDSERHWARAGDVIVLPYGDGHRMGGTEPAEWVSIAELIDPPPWQQMRSSGTADPAPPLRSFAVISPATTRCSTHGCALCRPSSWSDLPRARRRELETILFNLAKGFEDSELGAVPWPS